MLAQPNYLYTTQNEWEPSDDFFPDQWALSEDKGINMPAAWDIERGTNSVRVGVIEAGIDKDHEDLAGRVSFGTLSLDKNGGKVHGTEVGGIISAIADNEIGIAGITNSPLVMLDRGDFIGSLDYAIKNGIKIVNASFGYRIPGDEYALSNPIHLQAIQNFGANGGLLVCSAGNDSADTDETPHYPSGYGDSRLFPSVDNVISVGAAKQNKQRALFSNYGVNSVHIYAPGNDIYVLEHGGEWMYDGGTSMAAPHVSGVAALILSKYPDLDAVSVKSAILDSATPITVATPDGKQESFFLNAYDALCEAESISDPVELSVGSGSSVGNWKIKIKNPNSESVTVVYNERMCFEEDAKNFCHLTNLRSFTLAGGASRTVTITGFGTADYIAVAVNCSLSNGGSLYRISYANGLSISGMNAPKHYTVSGGLTSWMESPPSYLKFEITGQSGLLPYEWDIKLVNPNPVAVSVTYNSKMCFDDAARNFYGLRDLADVIVPANSSTTVRIAGNGGAQFITAAINYTINGTRYRRVSSANGIALGSTNPLQHHEVQVASQFPEVGSVPSYITMVPVSRSGFLYYTWGIKISNPNSFAVEVSYNAKLCFEGDAKAFERLADIVTVTIPANSSKTVTINHNGTAGWIAASVNYSYNGYEYRRITYADGLAINPYRTNSPKHNQIRFT